MSRPHILVAGAALAVAAAASREREKAMTQPVSPEDAVNGHINRRTRTADHTTKDDE